MKIIWGLIMIVSLSFVGACKNPGDKPSLFVPETRALISTDRGNLYTENLKAINIGEEFYLRFEISIKVNFFQSFFSKKNIVPFSITIPATDIMDCTLTDYSGMVSITPASDSINNILRFDFSALASNKPQKYIVIFQCRARDEGNHSISISYGSQVNEIHSKTMTLAYGYGY